MYSSHAVYLKSTETNDGGSRDSENFNTGGRETDMTSQIDIKTNLEDSKAGVNETDLTSLISIKSEFEDHKFDGRETDVISQIVIKTESKEIVDESEMEEDPLKIKDEPLDYV